MSSTRKIAIVGAGMIAAIHRRAALAAGAQVVGVLASSPARSAEIAGAWGTPCAFADIEAVVESDAEAVHVCSPNGTHAPYVVRLLEAGKHVVCEKPLGITLEQAEQMAAAARTAGVIATVPFVYRYHPLVREIRARAVAGDFGTFNLLHGSYLQDWLLAPESSNWRVDPAKGGASRAFADIGSHWCDLVEWVSGHRFASLVAQTSIAVTDRPPVSGLPFTGVADDNRVGVATEDSATVMLRSSAGVPGSVVISQVAAGRKNRLWFELDGSKASAVFDQENPESFWRGDELGGRIIVRDPQHGSVEQRRLSRLPAGHAQGYGDCFDAFVADTYAAIDGELHAGLPTFEDGLRSALIVDAVLRSSGASAWTEI
jgi:predicted dehydrogenase